MSASTFRWLFEWQHLEEKPTSIEDVEKIVKRGSIPTFSFIFMISISSMIATLGLLANSAAVIIGAMIIAPLMSPIIAMSYGLVAGRWKLIVWALITILMGTILTIGVAFLITEAIGWKLAGSEIISRMKPNLLDLGVALAAGSAAAYAYSRTSVSSAFAGIAIAVALIPPLCTVGIVLSLGQDASVEVGLAIDIFNARGPLLLYFTNIIGIIFAGSMVFYWQYYRRRLFAILTLVLTLSCLAFILRPLGLSMNNLLIRNQVRRNLTVIASSLSPKDYTMVRLSSLSVRIGPEVVYVRADVVAPPGLITYQLIDEARDKLSEMIKKPVILELGISLETVIRSTSDKSTLRENRGPPK